MIKFDISYLIDAVCTGDVIADALLFECNSL